MAIERESLARHPKQAEAQQGENSQIDYSYDQWRQHSMRQLEQSYEQECERNLTA